MRTYKNICDIYDIKEKWTKIMDRQFKKEKKTKGNGKLMCQGNYPYL